MPYNNLILIKHLFTNYAKYASFKYAPQNTSYLIILQGHMGHSESGQSESAEIYFTNVLSNGNKIKYIGLMYV